MGDTLKTLSLLVLSIILSFLVSFFLIKAMPGGFVDEEVKFSQLFIDSYKIELIPTLKNYLTGHWGNSWAQPDQTVTGLIADAFRFTFLFQISAFIFILLGSFFLSFLSLQSRTVSRIIQSIAELGISLPLLFLAPVGIYIFVLKLNWAPLRYDETSSAYWLPIVCLSLRPLCFSAQILTQAWQQTQFQDYFRVARAKGLSLSQAFWKHGLKNSILGYLTQMTQIVGQLLTGSVLIESLFSFPGLGSLFVDSLKHRDLPVLLGVIFIFCLIYIFIQICLEKIQNVLEPRSQRAASL